MDTTARLVALIILIAFAVIGITRIVQRLRERRSVDRGNRLDIQNQSRENRPDWQNQDMPVVGAALWDSSQAQEQSQHHHHSEATQHHHMQTPIQHHVPAAPPIQHHVPVPTPPPMHH